MVMTELDWETNNLSPGCILGNIKITLVQLVV